MRHFRNPDEGIRPNREHLIKAAEAFPAAVVITDSNARIVLVNGLAEFIFGYSSEELIGQTAEVLMASRYRAVYRHRRLNSILLPGSPIISLTLAGCRKGGDEFPIEVSLTSIQTDSETLIIGAINDISARRQAENARQLSEEQYRSLFENAVFGIFRTGATGSIVDVNPSFCSMLGYDSAPELIGRPIFDFFQHQSQRLAMLQKLDSGDRIGSFDAMWRRRDGKTVAVRLDGRILRNTQGEVRGLEMFVEDVTYRLAVEEQLRHSQKMEAIGRLADSIVHDFNNLIAVILTQSELVMELEDLASICRETEVILNAADRAGALTRQLLAFSRKQAVQPRVFNLNDLLHNMDQMLGRLLPQDVEFNTLFSPDLGNILADPSQIEQVVMNLVVNARDAMPDGGRLTVETCNVELDDFYAREHLDVLPGRYVMLTVSDTGTGMSEEVRSRLFEPFFTTKRAGEGTGLGLSTVYAIVKKAEGHVWLYSEPNRGTAFKVYFPRVASAVESIKEEKDAVRAANRSAVILLVEDEERLRRSIQQLLERAGYVVLAASSGAEAIRILDENVSSIDLVLTDVGLAHIRGPELVERLKDRRPQMKAIYMSGFGTDSLRPNERAQLGDSFIQKPFHKDALLTQLARVLDVQDLPR
jgi:PAS domain S-box-containing protein